MLTNIALILAGVLLLAAALSRSPPPKGMAPEFWDRSPGGALFNAVVGVILGAAAVIYGVVALLD